MCYRAGWEGCELRSTSADTRQETPALLVAVHTIHIQITKVNTPVNTSSFICITVVSSCTMPSTICLSWAKTMLSAICLNTVCMVCKVSRRCSSLNCFKGMQVTLCLMLKPNRSDCEGNVFMISDSVNRTNALC